MGGEMTVLMPITPKKKKCTFRQAGFSLEPKKDFSKQRFVSRDVSSLATATVLPSPYMPGLRRSWGKRWQVAHQI